MIFVLIASFLGLTWLCYRLFDRDLFAPPVILCLMFSLCATISLYNMEKWAMWEFHANTYLLFLWGVLMFIGVSWLVWKQMFIRKKYLYQSMDSSQIMLRQTINPSLSLLALVIAADLVVLGLFFREVVRIAVDLGGYTGGGYMALMSAFRDASSYKGVLSLEEGIPVYLNQLIKLVTVFGYVYLYVFINNIVLRRIQWKDVPLLIPILLYCIQKLLNAGRIELLGVAAAAVTMWYMLWNRKNGWKHGFNLKMLCVCAGGFAAVILGFYLLRNVVGRNSSRDFLSYIANYAGSSTRLFDLYVQEPLEPGLWGQETFYSIHRFLAKYGITGEMFSKHLEYRFVGDVNLGNVYSAFRRYYHDFGITGLTLLQGLSAFIFNSFYLSLKYRKEKKRIADYPLLLYSFIVYALFIIPIDDHIYSTELSVSTFTTYILLFIAYWMVFDFDWNGMWRRLYTGVAGCLPHRGKRTI